jgi:hypothetical protein
VRKPPTRKSDRSGGRCRVISITRITCGDEPVADDRLPQVGHDRVERLRFEFRFRDPRN